ncbi:MAG TPA: HD-GYP domain-containing protein [Firmicutes bacterium]|nr:HD-GYP domain-containing protein [Candidatus Fermentithermobacillaceae bacterium]
MKRKLGTFETLYTLFIAGLGFYVLARNVPDLSRPVEAFFLLLLVLIGEYSPVPVPRGDGSISVSPPLLFTVAVLYGPGLAVWIACIATIRKKDLLGQVPIPIVLFNRGMLSLSIYGFCKVYALLGGVQGVFSLARDVPAFIAAATTYTVINAFLVSIEFAFMLRTSLISVWRTNIIWSLPNMFALFPFGLLMVLVCAQGGPLYLLIFLLPMFVAKYSLEKYIELRDAYAEMAGALANAIDFRDSYTRGHSERVAEYAVMLAKELKLPDDRVELIRYVGLLHDVGKVGIRDAIMKKPGRFTFDEYEEMKSHAKMGADMLMGMKFLGRGQDWVRYHHERWDGKGFPDGLAGEEIPLEARILACADSFDAMTTDRPYKQRMSFEDAREELLRCSGTQFDPRVVQAMMAVIDKLIANRK